jgi:outer membrane phospholipase A
MKPTFLMIYVFPIEVQYHKGHQGLSLFHGSYKIPLVATAKREQGHAFPIRRLISQRSLVQLYSGKGSSLAIYKQQILNT